MRKLILASLLLAGINVQMARASDEVESPSFSDHMSGQRSAKVGNDISVLSYNVKGLPWPLASGRHKALQRIGERLAIMREQGTQPNIVLLQEAFTNNAKAIGKLGGYRYAAYGPTKHDRNDSDEGSNVETARRHRSILKGEGLGKWQDSGLVILSDFPIMATSKLAFPKGACAGYDCLANKGVLVAWVKFPGVDQPIAIADTHLNSRKATGVNPVRADTAFGIQASSARQFIAKQIPFLQAAILAGDFNVGHAQSRIALFESAPLLAGGEEGVSKAVKAAQIALADIGSANALANRNKDLLFARSGSQASFTLTSLSTPFGFESDSKPLSDHVGYIANYSIEAAS